MTSRLEELTKVWRGETNREYKGMCRIVMQMVDEQQVDGNTRLVEAVLNKKWGSVSRFFAAIDENHDVSSFVGSKGGLFPQYVRSLVKLHLPKEMNAGFYFDEEQIIHPRRKQRIPAKMVMPVVVGVLALICLLYVGVNMVGTGQRSEKKAEQSSLEARLEKCLEEQAKQARLIETQGEIIKKLDGRVTSLAGSQAHVDAERSRKLETGLTDLKNQGDACVQKVTKDMQEELKTTNDRAAELAKFFAINKIAIDDLGELLKKVKTEAEEIQGSLTSIQDQVKPLKTQLDQTDSRSKDMHVKVDMISDDLNNNFYVYVSLLALVVIFCGAVTCYVKSSVVYMDHSIISFHKKYDDHFELLTGSHDRFRIIENRLEAVEDSLAARDRAPRAEKESFQDNQDAAPVPAGPGRGRGRKGPK
jgi:hypothetical protein